MSRSLCASVQNPVEKKLWIEQHGVRFIKRQFGIRVRIVKLKIDIEIGCFGEAPHQARFEESFNSRLVFIIGSIEGKGRDEY